MPSVPAAVPTRDHDGRDCRYCGDGVDHRKPHLAFLDRSSAHVVCYELAEVARVRAVAARAVASPDALADEAEAPFTEE
jgi:hypothetical protein